LDGKVAIVTGAAHGIGRGHALELAKHGATVVVNDLGTTISGDGSGRDADVVVDIIRSRGGRAIADYGDAPRSMHRVTIAGEVPVAIDGRRSEALVGDSATYVDVGG
jgi:NAD(P)-dependent dehydrogenase (short-subunit alcohol dehydrogenase family)